MRYAYDQNFDPESQLFGSIKVDKIGMVGYSMGGGRIIRGLSKIQAGASQVEAQRAQQAAVAASKQAAAVAALLAMYPNTSSAVAALLAMYPNASSSATATSNILGPTIRRLLGGDYDQDAEKLQRCDSALCMASLCRVAVSLQGWNEGPGSSTSTPLLMLTTDLDAAVGPWWGSSHLQFE
jgi:hypothetical protein